MNDATAARRGAGLPAAAPVVGRRRSCRWRSSCPPRPRCSAAAAGRTVAHDRPRPADRAGRRRPRRRRAGRRGDRRDPGPGRADRPAAGRAHRARRRAGRRGRPEAGCRGPPPRRQRPPRPAADRDGCAARTLARVREAVAARRSAPRSWWEPAGRAGRPGRLGGGVLRDLRGAAGMSGCSARRAMSGGAARLDDVAVEALQDVAGRRARRALVLLARRRVPRRPHQSRPRAPTPTCTGSCAAQIEQTLTQLGQRPVSAQPAYATPQPVTDAASAAGLLVVAETDAAAAWRSVWNAARDRGLREPASRRSPKPRPAARAGARSSVPRPRSRSSPAAPERA